MPRVLNLNSKILTAVVQPFSESTPCGLIVWDSLLFKSHNPEQKSFLLFYLFICYNTLEFNIVTVFTVFFSSEMVK